MTYKNNLPKDHSFAENFITLKWVEVIEDKINFHFDQFGFNAWLENDNKHIPEIYNLEQVAIGVYSFNSSQLPDLFAQTSLRLSLDNGTDRLQYTIQDNYRPYLVGESFELFLEEKNYILLLLILNKSKSLWAQTFESLSAHCSSNEFEIYKSKNIPLKLAVIGSCFSRSIFRSDGFFNPDYKNFFTVPLTFFHNSIISLMSDCIKDLDYRSISDLLGDQVFRYVEVEFNKEIKERLSLACIDYLVVDNYSDATLEAIEVSENCFITYNKYLAESIYKRKLSGKKIFTPGELSHVEKYRQAVRKLYLVLQELNLDKRIILVGGRLSIFKTNSEIWRSKMDWIKKTNRNWDVYDVIFLEEFPDAQYIDMRSTAWISDINSPIAGGASPSHYQSGFYKDVYEEIMRIIFNGYSR